MKLKLILLSLLVGCLVVFTLNSTYFSARKPFWLDEIHSYQQSLTAQSYANILIHGPKGQGSPSPLDYLIGKTSVLLRSPLAYLHLQPFQYFRFHNLVYIWSTVLLIFYTSSRLTSSKTLTALVVALPTFIFNASVFYFHSELRPYALWVDLSLLLLFLIYTRKKTKLLWFVTLIFLTLTATASAYQITALLLALFIVQRLFPRRQIFGLHLNYLSLPLYLSMLINLYYISKVKSFGYPTPPWALFWDFYQPFLPAIIAGLLLSLHHYQHRQLDHLVASLTATFWLVLAPFSFYMTRQKGFFFTPRQYIYFFPVLTLFIFQFLDILFSLRLRPLLLTLILTIFMSSTAHLILSHTNVSARTALHLALEGQPISIPVNFQLLSPSYPQSIPAQISFQKTADTTEAYLSEVNSQLWWQYLSEVYPPRLYPRDPNSTLFVRDRDISFEIVNIQKP